MGANYNNSLGANYFTSTLPALQYNSLSVYVSGFFVCFNMPDGAWCLFLDCFFKQKTFFFLIRWNLKDLALPSKYLTQTETEQKKARLWRQLCEVKLIIAQIIMQVYPDQLQTPVYEHVKQAVTLLLVKLQILKLQHFTVQFTSSLLLLLLFCCKVNLEVNKQLES